MVDPCRPFGELVKPPFAERNRAPRIARRALACRRSAIIARLATLRRERHAAAAVDRALRSKPQVDSGSEHDVATTVQSGSAGARQRGGRAARMPPAARRTRPIVTWPRKSARPAGKTQGRYARCTSEASSPHLAQSCGEPDPSTVAAARLGNCPYSRRQPRTLVAGDLPHLQPRPQPRERSAHVGHASSATRPKTELQVRLGRVHPRTAARGDHGARGGLPAATAAA